jgi:hypothetical protein
MAKTPKSRSPRKKTKLTIKERKLLQGIAKGLSVSAAARQAGYADSTSKVDVYKTLDKPRVQTAFLAILEKKGITDDKLGQVIADGLDANKVISANVIAPNGEGMADAHSMTKDFVEVPDHPTRHKFVDTVCKLKSHYPNEKIDVKHSVGAEGDEDFLSWLLQSKKK